MTNMNEARRHAKALTIDSCAGAEQADALLKVAEVPANHPARADLKLALQYLRRALENLNQEQV